MKKLESILNTPNISVRNLSEDGGIGEIWRAGKRFGSVIWSSGAGWEHVSIAPYDRRTVPSWDDMCRLKDMFFEDDEVVVQYHPAKSQYVNNLPNCLHLRRPIDEALPTPPSIMVGIRDGQTVAEARAEAKSLLEGEK
jgi:hypothetical protein